MTAISEIQIIPIKPQNGIIGFVSLVIDGKFYISSIAIHSKLDGSGYRLTYPKKNNLTVFHPITRETSKKIEEAVIEKFKNVMNIPNVRHSCPVDTRK